MNNMSQNKKFETVKEAVVYTAKKFSSVLKTYNSQTRVGLFYDDDPDGICSGIILEKTLGFKEIPVVERIPFSNDLAPFSDKFNAVVKDRRLNVLLMTDFNIAGFGHLDAYLKFRKLFPDIDVIIFDHHQDSSDYKTDYYFNSNELQGQILGNQLCCSKFVFEVCKLICSDISKFSWLKAIGIIADSNQETWGRDVVRLIEKLNSDLINSPDESIREYNIPEESDEFFQNPFGKVANLIFYGLAKSSSEISKIYDILFTAKGIFEVEDKLKEYSLIEDEVDDYIENFNYYLKNAYTPSDELHIFEMEVKGEYDLQCILSNLLSHQNEDILFIIYRKKKDNFIYASLRLQNKSINMGSLAELAADFPDGNGGGHIPAAGIKIKKDDFKPFKKKLFEKLIKLEKN